MKFYVDQYPRLHKREPSINHKLVPRRAWDWETQLFDCRAFVRVVKLTDNCGSWLAPMGSSFVDSMCVKNKTTTTSAAALHHVILLRNVGIRVPGG